MNSERQITGKSGLPLVRLSLLHPFVLALDKRQVNVDSVLRKHSLGRESLASPDVFVPAQTMYKIIETMALAAEDPYLAVHVGETLDLFAWPVFTDAAMQAVTFGEFFFHFAAEATNQASSVQMRLDTDGQHATFCAYRVFEPSMVPAQADAFYVGLFTTIFRQCTGDKWDPREVLVSLGDPDAVPPGYHDLTITRGDRRGPSILFPQKWLLFPMHIKGDDDRLKVEVDYQSPPRSLNEAIRQALLPHLHRCDLTTEQAAKLCGYDRRVLGRKLKAMGSSLTKEIALLREEQASRILKETSQPIAEVGGSVGFSDPSVFSRAFKKWTGLSPRNFRKQDN